MYTACDPGDSDPNDDSGSGGTAGADAGTDSTGGTNNGSPDPNGETPTSDLLIPRNSTLSLSPIPDVTTTNIEFLAARARRMKIDGVWTGLVNRFSLIDADPPDPTCEQDDLGQEECTWLLEFPGTTHTFVSRRISDGIFQWRVYIEGGIPSVERFMQIEGTITEQTGAFSIYSLDPEHHEDVEDEFTWTSTLGVEDVNVLNYLVAEGSKQNTFERLTVDSSSGSAEFQSTYYTDPVDQALVRWTLDANTAEYSLDGGVTWKSSD